MRRTPILSLLLLGALAPTFASASAAQEGGSTGKPPLRASLAACQTGATEEERFAIFTGSMPARRGTVRMAMRFDLYERTGPGGPWRRVSAPDLGRWERSQPLRAGFVWTKRVERLRDGAAYRSVVRLRWYAARGRVQAELRRTTPVCRQPDRRADLEVESLLIAPGPDEATARYTVTVVNTGQSAAGPFGVGVGSAAVDGVRAVFGLAAGERTTVELVAERCSSELAPVTATVDVRDEVDEADERDNSVRKLCGAR